MAIVEEKSVVSDDGIKKGIDENSMGMALDILQRGLYAHPIESTVRELASNAYDAVIERDVAKAILTGETTVEEHFDVSKIDGIFHASGWDPDYFDLKWLSDDPNVNIFYEEGKLKDTLRFVDNGVGLGKNRIVGYFQLNYSSKRANKDSLGRFGLGSKVALSLGVDSFRVTTRYNGRKFKFDVYLDKVDSIVSKFGESGTNNYVELPTGRYHKDEDGNNIMDKPIMYKAFYEETTEKNGLELIVEVKKHNKKRFFEAIESQLMYMPRIKFYHKAEGSFTHKEVPIKANILYRDKDIVISDSNMYNKPHILLGTGDALINYGFIAFNELEIEPKNGAVGLILDINDIEVTPSREAAIWSAKTRKAVLEKYESVKKTATRFVNDALANEKDFLQWLVKTGSTLNSIRNGSSQGSNDAISKLASIIDIQDIKDISFPGDRTIKYPEDFNKFFSKDYTMRIVKYDSWRKKVERDKVTDPSQFSLPVFRSTGTKAESLRDRYLFDTHGRFILITQKEDATIDKNTKLLLSSGGIQNYDTITIPPDILESYLASDMDDEDMDEQIVQKFDRAALRKQNQQIVMHTAKENYGSYNFSSSEHYIKDLVAKQSDSKLVYAQFSQREDVLELMHGMPAKTINAYDAYLNDKHSSYKDELVQKYCGNKPASFHLASNENLKHLDNSSSFTRMDNWAIKKLNKKTGTITFSNEIKLAASLSLLKRLADSMMEPYEYVKTQSRDMIHTFAHDNMVYIDSDMQKKFVDLYAVTMSGSTQPKEYLGFKAGSFWSYCIELNGMRAGLLPRNETREEELLELMDWEVPSFLCDKLEDFIIQDIDILDVEFINNYLNDIRKYLKNLDVMYLYLGTYFYRDENAEYLGSIMKNLLVTNDAVLQQPTDSEDSGDVGQNVH